MRAVTSLITAHLMGAVTVCRKFHLTTKDKKAKKSKKDKMKKDDMKDDMKKDAMKKDEVQKN